MHRNHRTCCPVTAEPLRWLFVVMLVLGSSFACGGEDDSFGSTESSIFSTKDPSAPPPGTVVDCNGSDGTFCVECDVVGGYICCVYEPCTVVPKKPSKLLMQ